MFVSGEFALEVHRTDGDVVMIDPLIGAPVPGYESTPAEASLELSQINLADLLVDHSSSLDGLVGGSPGGPILHSDFGESYFSHQTNDVVAPLLSPDIYIDF